LRVIRVISFVCRFSVIDGTVRGGVCTYVRTYIGAYLSADSYVPRYAMYAMHEAGLVGVQPSSSWPARSHLIHVGMEYTCTKPFWDASRNVVVHHYPAAQGELHRRSLTFLILSATPTAAPYQSVHVALSCCPCCAVMALY